MTADIRAAALAEARSTGMHHELSSAHYTRAFTAGAAWAAARVTPPREQIAEVIADEEEYPHPRGYLKHADAVLKLMQELAEGNDDSTE